GPAQAFSITRIQLSADSRRSLVIKALKMSAAGFLAYICCYPHVHRVGGMVKYPRSRTVTGVYGSVTPRAAVVQPHQGRLGIVGARITAARARNARRLASPT